MGAGGEGGRLKNGTHAGSEDIPLPQSLHAFQKALLSRPGLLRPQEPAALLAGKRGSEPSLG